MNIYNIVCKRHKEPTQTYKEQELGVIKNVAEVRCVMDVLWWGGQGSVSVSGFSTGGGARLLLHKETKSNNVIQSPTAALQGSGLVMRDPVLPALWFRLLTALQTLTGVPPFLAD